MNLTGLDYDPNRFRADLPGGIQKVSPDLYAFLRETLQGLRQFNSDALHGALRLNQQVLTTRYIDAVYPQDSLAAVQLSTEQTAFARFNRLPDAPDSANLGRLLYRGINGALTTDGEDVEFAGIDYTRSGVGEYGWVVYGGYAPIHENIFAEESPAVVGVAGPQFSTLASLKWGTIEGELIYLMPAFGVPGEVGGSSLASLLARLAESEADIATLKDSIQSITQAFGKFKSTSIVALSRIENRTNDEYLQSVYSEFLEQTANTIAIGRQISVDREFINDQTGVMKGYVQASQKESVRAQSYSYDSKFWADAAQDIQLSAQAHSQASQTFASASQTFSVAAGEFASKAEIALAAMATIGAPSLVENYGFDTWSDPLLAPDKWALSTDPAYVTWNQIAGPTTPFAVQFSVAASTAIGDHYLYQDVSLQTNDQLGVVIPGWYVVELNFKLAAGLISAQQFRLRAKLNGAAAGFVSTIDLTDFIAAGIPIGVGVTGTFYRSAVLVDLTQESFDELIPELLLHRDGATASTATFEVDLFSVREATQAEVATQTILTSVVDQVATMQNTVNLLVSQVASQATSITNLSSSFNGFDDRLNLVENATGTLTQASAQYALQITALTNASNSYAGRLDSLDASFTAIDIAVDALGTTVTGHVTTLANHTTELQTHANQLSSQATSINNLTASYNATVPGLVNSVASNTSQISVLTNAQTAQSTSIATLTSRVDNNESSIIVAQNTLNGVLAKYTLILDVNGDIVGVELINGADQREINLRADKLNLRTSAGLKQLLSVSGDKVEFGTDLHIQQYKIIYDNGIAMRVTGLGFGVNNEFVDWFGPSMPVSQCSRANGDWWLSGTTREGYFGGGISAGILKNAQTTSDTSPNASVTVGPFGSNGDPISVVVTYTATDTSPIQHYPATNAGVAAWNSDVSAFGAPIDDYVNYTKPASNVTVVVRVDRVVGGVNTVSWITLDSVVGTVTLRGTRPIPGDTTGDLETVLAVSGSITGTDNLGGVSNRQITATLVTRNGLALYPAFSQRISIVALEQ